MKRVWVVVALALVAPGCKNGKAGDRHAVQAGGSGSGAGSGSGSGSGSVSESHPAWTIVSQPIDLSCNGKPLPLPAPAAAPAAAAPRALPRADAIHACPGQASVAAACACLAKSIKAWGSDLGLSPRVDCAPQPPAGGDAQLVELISKPADDMTISGGEAFVLVARAGATWSPVAEIEAAPDVDLSVTPQASQTATIDRVQSHALAAGTLYWIDSHYEAQDKDAGDTEHTGEAHGTLCVVAPGAAPYCGKPLALGAWSYTFSLPKADQPDACTVGSASIYTATVDPTSVTVKLAHGSDSGGVAGRYTF